MGDINYEIGNNEKAIEYLYASIETIQILNEIAEEKINSENLEDFTTDYVNSYYELAMILFDTEGNASELNKIGNYLESWEYYDRNFFLIDRLIFNKKLNKYLNIEINKKEIIEDIERYKEYIKPDKLIDVLSPYQFYHLYQFSDEISYLESAYDKIHEDIDNLEPAVKAKFLSYPIPKAIVEEWEKVK